MIRKIGRHEMWDIMRKSRSRLPVIIDMCNEGSYHRAHLPGAMQLSMDELEDWLMLEKPDPHEKVIFYAEGPENPNPLRGAHFLEVMGFDDILYYPGGKDEWMLSRLPIVSEDFRQVPPSEAG